MSRRLTLRIWVLPENPGDSWDREVDDVWAVSTGRAGKLYVDHGFDEHGWGKIEVLEPDAWHRYEIVKTEKEESDGNLR